MTPVDSSLLKLEWSHETWLEDSVAYAPQSSYIRHGTVRDNILFGQPFWEERYYQVLQQCSLGSDLELLVNGDLTEVGENGVNLSGGQKARINLARCVYSRARTIYLDDILSAVDAHTAQFIVDACLRGSLVKGRTLVLVSHHVDLCLPAAEYVVALDAGRVQQACRAKNAQIASLRALASPKSTKDELPPVPGSPEQEKRPNALDATLDTLNELHRLQEQSHISLHSPPSLSSVETQRDGPRELYAEEHQAHGHVATSHYMMMIKAAGGPAYWAFFVLLYLGTKGTSMLVSWVLQWWTADPAPDHLDHYLLLYISANLATTLLGGARWVWLYGIGNIGWYSSGTKKIHKRLFEKIANAPLSFFETTPAGRILNVFAQDVRRMDGSSADDFGRTTMECECICI
jgi:ABC-type multidrug transport system fused ATPase/permease subunit